MAAKKGSALATVASVTKGRKKDALQRKPSSRTDKGTQARRKWAARIRELWADGIKATIEIGKALSAAKKELTRYEFLRMVRDDLPFHELTFTRLMQIARHPVLSDCSRVNNLPPSWGTLYILSRLPPKRMLALIKNGTITPRMERSEAEALVTKPAKSSSPATRYQTVEVTHEIEKVRTVAYVSDDAGPYTPPVPYSCGGYPRAEDTEPSPDIEPQPDDDIEESHLKVVRLEPPPIDRLASLLAAWEAADDVARREFLLRINARHINDGA